MIKLDKGAQSTEKPAEYVTNEMQFQILSTHYQNLNTQYSTAKLWQALAQREPARDRHRQKQVRQKSEF